MREWHIVYTLCRECREVQIPGKAALLIEPRKGPGRRTPPFAAGGAVGCTGLEIPRRKQNVGGALTADSLGVPMHVFAWE